MQADLVAATGSAEPEVVPAALRARVAEASRPGPVLGSLRCGRRLAWDDETDVWEALDVATGERVLCATGARLERIAAGSPLPARVVRDPVPHVRWEAVGCLLSDLLPVEEDLVFAARVLAAIPARGTVSPDLLVLRNGRWLCAWPGDDGEPDLASLSAALDPTDRLAGDLRRALATALTGERHRLVARARDIGRRDHRHRLRQLIARLARFGPPIASGTLGALRVVSDGRSVVVGEGAVAWDGTLDPRVTRAVLRAAAGSPDPALSGLVRWLAAASRLRVDRYCLMAGG